MHHLPYSLLDGQCILRSYGEADIFGGREVISETRLRHIHTELYCQREADKNGEKLISRGRLFYDCGRSVPDDVMFSAGGGCSVVIGSEELWVTEMRYHYSGGRLRIIELELKGGERSERDKKL